jgi:hypothetical protein
MKKSAALIILSLLAAGTAAASDRLLVAAGVSYLLPADSGFKDVYGSRVFYPEAWAGVRVFRGVHVLGGFGWFTKKGTTPELELPAKSTQRLLWAGLGYVGEVNRSILFKVEAGPARIGYKEEALDLSVSGSALGFRAGFGLIFLGEAVFTALDIGYIGASDTVGDVPIKLGGFKATLSVGVRL